MEQLHQWDTDGLIMARKHIHRAQAELAHVVQTTHFGVGPAVGFHPDVNRRLLGPLPPRPVQVKPPLNTAMLICLWQSILVVQSRLYRFDAVNKLVELQWS